MGRDGVSAPIQYVDEVARYAETGELDRKSVV